MLARVRTLRTTRLRAGRAGYVDEKMVGCGGRCRRFGFDESSWGGSRRDGFGSNDEMGVSARSCRALFPAVDHRAAPSAPQSGGYWDFKPVFGMDFCRLDRRFNLGVYATPTNSRAALIIGLILSGRLGPTGIPRVFPNCGVFPVNLLLVIPLGLEPLAVLVVFRRLFGFVVLFCPTDKVPKTRDQAPHEKDQPAGKKSYLYGKA